MEFALGRPFSHSPGSPVLSSLYTVHASGITSHCLVTVTCRIHSLLGIFPGCFASLLGHQALRKTYLLVFPKSYCERSL